MYTKVSTFDICIPVTILNYWAMVIFSYIANTTFERDCYFELQVVDTFIFCALSNAFL